MNSAGRPFMPRKRVVGLLRLFRFELPFAAGVCVVLGEILALGRIPPAYELALGFLSFFCISATALILNDYFDLETDRINAPQRPLPSGLVTKRDALVLSIVVALLGFLAGALISLTALLVTFVVWVAGVLYNWRFKRTGFLGNLIVSFSVGMTFIFGGIAVGNLNNKVVWWFGAIAMLIDLGEEIAADAMDVEGDRLSGSRSLAVVMGAKKALRISGAIFVLVVLISSIPFVAGWLRGIYLSPIVILDVVILYATTRMMGATNAQGRRYIRWIYLGGLLAIVLFIFLTLMQGGSNG
jgi:geranylgeranylglycerol-phosphate geranylgeranyltransferase